MTDTSASDSLDVRCPDVSPEDKQPHIGSTSEVVLQVGERIFRTSTTTLVGGSTYFASMFSGSWMEGRRGIRDPLFIDAEPTLFEHILRYLRRGVFPFLWNASKGFDYGLYAALLRESQYFGVDTLSEWIAEKKYLDTVQVRYSLDQIEASRNEHVDDTRLNTILRPNVHRTIYPTWCTKKEYRCPRGIFVHHGDASRCGRACEKATAEGQDLYEDVLVLRTLVYDRSIYFDYEKCYE